MSNLFAYKSHTYTQDLTLNNPPELICHKTQPNQIGWPKSQTELLSELYVNEVVIVYSNVFVHRSSFAQSAKAVEYTDSISAEG